jgi:hypothetical protein
MKNSNHKSENKYDKNNGNVDGIAFTPSEKFLPVNNF